MIGPVAAAGTYVVVRVTGEGGRVVGREFDSSSWESCALVCLDSGKTAALPWDEIEIDARRAQPAAAP